MIRDVTELVVNVNNDLVNYLLIYLIIFHSGINKRKSDWIWGMGLLWGAESGLAFYRDIKLAAGAEILCLIVIPVFFLRERKKKWFALYPVILTGTAMINICAAYVVGMVMNIPQAEVADSMFWRVVCANVPNVFVLLAYIYQKLRKRVVEEIEITWCQYVAFYIALVCSLILAGSLQFITEMKILNMRMMNIYGLTVSVICVLFVTTNLWQGMLAAQGRKYRTQTELYETYMKMQDQRIHEIIWNDEKMRRFRHDMQAHLTAIKSYLEQSESKEAGEYYRAMVEQSAVYDRKTYSGNQAVDAVIGQLSEMAERKEIELKYLGNVLADCEISSFDLCTIVSNLLCNAIDACEREKGKREINVEIFQYERNLCIIVRNAVAEQVSIQDGQPVCGKSDNRYHGLGIGNIKNIVDKYQGSMEYIWENGWLQAKILL